MTLAQDPITKIMSLYYYSETTFINLPKKSRDVQLEFFYKPDRKHSDLQKEASSYGKVLTNGSSYKVFKTTFGNLTMVPEKTTTQFYKSPNGLLAHQGWIQKKEQLPTKKYLNGDLKKLQNLRSKIGNFKSYKVNVKVPSKNPTFLRNVLINRLREENTQFIVVENFIKKGRFHYSQKLLEKLFDKDVLGALTYKPTMKNLFDDFIIRQGLEVSNSKIRNIWSQPIEKLRNEFLKLKTFKGQYQIDITPVLMKAFPKDEITKKLTSFGYESQNYIQFNEFKHDFVASVKRVVGFIKATEYLGYFVADNAISEVAHVEVHLLSQIRKFLSVGKDPYIKYLVWDYEKCPEIHFPEYNLKKLYTKQNFIMGFIANEIHGHAPLVVPGESLVWHQRTEHRFSLIGKYNPALINYNIAHWLENKWFEYKYYERYCPGAMPKTRLLSDLLPKGVSNINVPPEIFLKVANENFPQGWILKGVYDYNSIVHRLTHKTDVLKLYNGYIKSDFDLFEKNAKKNLFGCEPVEDLNGATENHPHFQGSKIFKKLANAKEVFLQEWMDIKVEYRSECATGECPLESFSDAFVGGTKFDLKRKFGRAYSFFQGCINKIPAQVRGMPLTADVCEKKDGSFSIIETNPGGNGWLIHNSPDITRRHNKFLREFPEILEADAIGKISGLSPEGQMKYIENMMKKWNYTFEEYATHFTPRLPDRLLDIKVKVHQIRKNRLETQKKRPTANCVVRLQRKIGTVAGMIKNWLKTIQPTTIGEYESVLQMVYNFNIGYNPKSYKNIISHELLTNVTTKVKFDVMEKAQIQFYRQLVAEKNKFETNSKLTKSLFRRLATVTMESIYHIDLLKKVGIQNKRIENISKKIFDFLTQENGKKLIDENMVKKRIDRIIKQLDSNSSKKKSQITTMFLDLREEILDVKSADRLNLDIGVTFKKYMTILTENFRRIFHFFPANTKRTAFKTHYYKNLIGLINFVIQEHSDSIISLSKEAFFEEYQFLVQFLKELKSGENTGLLAETLNSMKILGDNKKIQVLLNEKECEIEQNILPGKDFHLLLDVFRAYNENQLVQKNYVVGEFSRSLIFKILKKTELFKKQKKHIDEIIHDEL
eukprot:gene706-8958_t